MEGRPRVALTLEQCWHEVPGGTAVAGLGMARGLLARDDATPIAVAAWHRQPAPDPWRPPLPVKHLPLPRLALYEAWHRLRWPSVERATGPVDLIHATTLAIPPRSRPLVVTVHDLAFLNEPAHFTRRGLSFFRKGLELARRDADLILCPSKATLEHCRSIGIESERLRVVPMGAETRAASEGEVAAARARYSLERPYLMWLGTIEPRKNLPRLMRAFAEVAERVPEVELVLVGPRGWNENMEKLMDEVDRTRVRVLGFVPHEDLPPLYAGAEAFAFPSLFEGFGLPVIEAMAQGTPVLTSKGTSTEELGQDAAVLVDPNATEDIAAALESVLTDEALRTRLRSAGPRRAALYTWDETARGLVRCYGEVLA